MLAPNFPQDMHPSNSLWLHDHCLFTCRKSGPDERLEESYRDHWKTFWNWLASLVLDHQIIKTTPTIRIITCLRPEHQLPICHRLRCLESSKPKPGSTGEQFPSPESTKHWSSTRLGVTIDIVIPATRSNTCLCFLLFVQEQKHANQRDKHSCKRNVWL